MQKQDNLINEIQEILTAKEEIVENKYKSIADGFYKEKQWKKQQYFRFVFGMRQRVCTACNGSGYYDNCGSPDCGSCDGTGKELYHGPKALMLMQKEKRQCYIYKLNEKEKRALAKFEEVESEL